VTNLYIFELGDSECKILDPTNDNDNSTLLKTALDFARKIREIEEPAHPITLTEAELDHIASIHCDKWVEGTARHFMLYAGSSKPSLIQPKEQAEFSDYNTAKIKGFSGDISGVIGEALFALTLVKKYNLSETDFVHFSATDKIFPDFGIYNTSQSFAASAQKALNRAPTFNSSRTLLYAHVLPAEVKAFTGSQITEGQLQNRLFKAFLQLRSFWKTRQAKRGDKIFRGPSIIFIAVLNKTKRAYNGFIIWIT